MTSGFSPSPGGTGSPSPELVRALRRTAVELASGAAELALSGREKALSGEGVVDTKSTSTDVVTAMDRSCEDYLRAQIRKCRPQDAVLGEEAGVEGSFEGITWVVDPIDGTVNYVYGRPAYAVSVAAVLGDPTVPGSWWPIAGAVCNPVTGETFHAGLGEGAAMDSPAGRRALRCTSVSEIGQTLLATGFGYAAERRRLQALALVEILPVVRDIRREGSAALDLCSVGSGLVDAYAEMGVNSWDIAAGWLVAQEAGAQVSFWSAGAGLPAGIAASPPAVAQEIHDLMTYAYTVAGQQL
ncbi:inositol monophosphatase family protein [Austwickia chelonae]|uniref:Inositol-1-monophosphatase n=1 Tax=Austwickia chelonae NBRC 105200 TaxID=1184607 RepID=K6VQG2_9MICO|nr:inositol monophosphatase family protein [Austwickia chelonae]GAB77595.1 inositol monophosphatase SuhB [Austwickia chelonae NBRC 105200]